MNEVLGFFTNPRIQKTIYQRGVEFQFILIEFKYYNIQPIIAFAVSQIDSHKLRHESNLKFSLICFVTDWVRPKRVPSHPINFQIQYSGPNPETVLKVRPRSNPFAKYMHHILSNTFGRMSPAFKHIYRSKASPFYNWTKKLGREIIAHDLKGVQIQLKVGPAHEHLSRFFSFTDLCSSTYDSQNSRSSLPR